jgi:hypothetical protein
VLAGKLKHFYGVGFLTAVDKVALPLATIPVTVVATVPIMLAQPNKNEGFVDIVDLQLIQTGTGEILWSGSFSKKIERRYSDVYPVRVACEALKEIVKEIVLELDAVSIKTTGE